MRQGVLAGSILPYLVAVPFTGLGYLRAAPTATALQQDQDALDATGATTDLRAALA